MFSRRLQRGEGEARCPGLAWPSRPAPLLPATSSEAGDAAAAAAACSAEPRSLCCLFGLKTSKKAKSNSSHLVRPFCSRHRATRLPQRASAHQERGGSQISDRFLLGGL